jgi:hypothetical protein
MVCESAGRTGRLLVVHEDNRSGGFGAEVLATVAKRCLGIDGRRVTRPDTHIPCDHESQLRLLPSFAQVLEAAADMTGLALQWTQGAPCEPGPEVVRLLGARQTGRSRSASWWCAAATRWRPASRSQSWKLTRP